MVLYKYLKDLKSFRGKKDAFDCTANCWVENWCNNCQVKWCTFHFFMKQSWNYYFWNIKRMIYFSTWITQISYGSIKYTLWPWKPCNDGSNELFENSGTTVSKSFLAESCLPWLDACFQFNIRVPTTTDSRSFEGNTKRIKKLIEDTGASRYKWHTSGLDIFTITRRKFSKQDILVYSTNHFN